MRLTSGTPMGSPSRGVPGNQPGPFTKAEILSETLSMVWDFSYTF